MTGEGSNYAVIVLDFVALYRKRCEIEHRSQLIGSHVWVFDLCKNQ